MTEEEIRILEHKVSDYEEALKDVTKNLRWCSMTRSVVCDVDRAYRTADDVLRKYRIYA